MTQSTCLREVRIHFYHGMADGGESLAVKFSNAGILHYKDRVVGCIDLQLVTRGAGVASPEGDLKDPKQDLVPRSRPDTKTPRCSCKINKDLCPMAAGPGHRLPSHLYRPLTIISDDNAPFVDLATILAGDRRVGANTLNHTHHIQSIP